MGTIRIEVTSAGFSVGNTASVSVDGVVVPVPGGYGRGLNVVVFDETHGAVLEAHSYDTYGDPAAADNFAALVEALPVGRWVAVAVKDEATSKLTERAKATCESLGSASIRQLAYRGSWALVGRKGNLPGKVAESLSNSAQAMCDGWLQPLVEEGTNTFRVSTRSAGYSFGNFAEVYVDALPVISDATATRGFNVAVIDPDSGIVRAKQSFDVYGDANAAAALARFLDDTAVGTIVAVAVKDDASANVSDAARRSLQSVGSALIHNLGFRQSFTLIGKKGSAPGSVPELLSTSGAAGLSFVFPLTRSTSRPFHIVTVESAGFTVGNFARFSVDGEPVSFSAGTGRGLNVVVLDRAGRAQATYTFDTYGDPAAADKFAALVEQTAEGEFIAVAVQDEATNHLTERAKRACDSLGSTLIRQLTFRGSWAIIGRRGTLPGTVPEALANAAQAACSDWIPCKLEIPKGAPLVARSAGFGAGNAASVLNDGALVPVAGGYGRGLNAVVFDEAGGAVLDARCYDTHGDPAAADSFAALVEALAPGRVVAVVVQDEATDMLTERAKRACESLGSTRIRALGYRGSWALIGYKGAAPGSGMECLNNAGAVSTQMWIPYFITEASQSSTEKRGSGSSSGHQ